MASEQIQEQQPRDKIDEIIEYLSNDNVNDELPESLRTFKYAEGWNPDNLEEELQKHPFFMTELPKPGEPLPPLLEAFQQLKYSEEENDYHELAINHKTDGLFHFKIKKYRIAYGCFSEAIRYELKCEVVDKKLLSQLHNNRAACSWFISNYRSCVIDCEAAYKYDNEYIKPIKRAVCACEKLGRWEEVEVWCGRGEGLCVSGIGDAVKFFVDMRVKARIGKVGKKRGERKVVEEGKKVELMRRNVFECVSQRGIQVKGWGFLERSWGGGDGDDDGEEEARGEGVSSRGGGGDSYGRVVKLRDDGKLYWPVLILYPQYSQSDLIEGFCEEDCFRDHLEEMLIKNKPGWDEAGEYSNTLDDIEVLFISEDKFVNVDINESLLDTMKKPDYVVPLNGVPCFFVLSKGNQFCQVFKMRVDMEV